jgi:hypothetical protein
MDKENQIITPTSTIGEAGEVVERGRERGNADGKCGGCRGKIGSSNCEKEKKKGSGGSY